MTKPATLRVPAVIRKHEIAVYAGLSDKVNASAVKVAGATYEARTLQFVSFGSPEATTKYDAESRVWRGDYFFRFGTFDESVEEGDLSLLPGVEGVTDGL